LSGRSIESVVVNAPTTEQDDTPRTFKTKLNAAGRVIGLRPSFDRSYETVDVDAVAPAGRRVPLLPLRAADPEWYRRYLRAGPIELPQGTTVEVLATAAAADMLSPPPP